MTKSSKSAKKADPKSDKITQVKKTSKKSISKRSEKKGNTNVIYQKLIKKNSEEKLFFVFKDSNGSIEYLGSNKEFFRDYLEKNYSDWGLNFWEAESINDSIETGDAGEDHPIAIEIFDNGNSWVYCYPEASNVLFTQKQFDEGDELSVEMKPNILVYFKEESLLTANEKTLIK